MMAEDAIPGGLREAKPRRRKGELRRQALIEAAAELILEQGAYSVTHRAVADRAGASLSATTYYFKNLEELMEAAASLLIGKWTDQIRTAEIQLEDGGAIDNPVATLVDAVIPRKDPAEARRFYETLGAAGQSARLGASISSIRPELDKAVTRLADRVLPGLPFDGQVIIALIDGAALQAFSAGTDPRPWAVELVQSVVDAVRPTAEA